MLVRWPVVSQAGSHRQCGRPNCPPMVEVRLSCQFSDIAHSYAEYLSLDAILSTVVRLLISQSNGGDKKLKIEMYRQFLNFSIELNGQEGIDETSAAWPRLPRRKEGVSKCGGRRLPMPSSPRACPDGTA
ncbi:hypothetical protein OX459_20390 [Janthinobacterium sp. SUN026]|uniref:hypothetical protein n=1 Tax=Janthinobacterium sp. SUN026 TaxID=3002438 RepID=UPI0025B09007|nr:hypothetical protein [Janthinobacterium sp. SUN026]MDN2673766.1 hypothetical protein [Janthinobacterium sp. SUN026]